MEVSPWLLQLCTRDAARIRAHRRQIHAPAVRPGTAASHAAPGLWNLDVPPWSPPRREAPRRDARRYSTARVIGANTSGAISPVVG
jgi:hypothetical protein